MTVQAVGAGSWGAGGQAFGFGWERWQISVHSDLSCGNNSLSKISQLRPLIDFDCGITFIRHNWVRREDVAFPLHSN